MFKKLIADIRKIMNKEESSASGKVIDSLINYETIKLFGRESFEADRYDASLQRYQAASVRTQTSLSALNFGQNFLFSCGLTAIMCMAVSDITSGENISRLLPISWYQLFVWGLVFIYVYV